MKDKKDKIEDVFDKKDTDTDTVQPTEKTDIQALLDTVKKQSADIELLKSVADKKALTLVLST